MFQFTFKKTGLTPLRFFKKRPEISSYLKRLNGILRERDYSFPENFLIFPEEKPGYFKGLTKKHKLIIIIGIGGSILGAEAIYRALEKKQDLSKILFLDSLNPLFSGKIVSELKSKNFRKGEIAICFISKSGKTLEPLANFFSLYPIFKKYKPETFVITEENSPLWNFAKKKKWKLLSIPETAIGRYSFFSNVGQLPLFLSGINLKELFLGAREANKTCLRDDPLKNPALSSALTIFYHRKSGKNIYSNLVFPPDLELFAKWYCQLMAESLGKDGKGITPTVALGTADFHSLGQLYFDGPRDKLINFIFVENIVPDFKIGKIEDFNKFFPGLEKTRIWKANKAIFEGVKRVYLKKEIPFTETILPALDERNLGALMETKMIEVIILAKLMKVYAFDQPGVELYKKEARKILEKKKGRKLKYFKKNL